MDRESLLGPVDHTLVGGTLLLHMDFFKYSQDACDTRNE